MGNSHKVNHQDEESASQIMKRKNQIDFKQTDFIRQIEGSIESEYEILSPVLKQNQFYELRKVIHIKTKLIRSVYIINKYKIRSTQRQLLQDQINRLKQIDHPNVSKIYQLAKDNHRFYIVMELCYGESLASMLQRQIYLDQYRACSIIYQLLNVLGHCHRKDIIHTDLKLDNIIFNSKKQDVVKIVDFSISRIFRIDQIVDQSKAKVFLSSPQSFNNEQSVKSDIWQCGIILYILLCGEAPFIGTKKSTLIKKIRMFIPRFQEKRFQFISRQAKNLLKKMLKQNVNERYSAQECLAHPWFKKFYKPPSISQLNLNRCLIQCYNFNPSSKLQQATWEFFVNLLVLTEEKQNILAVFNKLDRRARGQLSQQDVHQGFFQIYKSQKKAKFFAQFIFRRLKRQNLMFSHFVSICTSRQFLITKSNIKKVFQIFDEDGSGQISVLELKDVLGASKQVTQDVWLQLMKQADANSDGMISFEEFTEMMKELLNKKNLDIVQLMEEAQQCQQIKE